MLSGSGPYRTAPPTSAVRVCARMSTTNSAEGMKAGTKSVSELNETLKDENAKWQEDGRVNLRQKVQRV